MCIKCEKQLDDEDNIPTVVTGLKPCSGPGDSRIYDCAYCRTIGDDPSLVFLEPIGDKKIDAHAVVCRSCGSRGPWYRAFDTLNNMHAAIFRWNQMQILLLMMFNNCNGDEIRDMGHEWIAKSSGFCDDDYDYAAAYDSLRELT